MKKLREIWDTRKMSREDIDEFVNEKGDQWIIAAMIEGSIGYHTYDHAKMILESYKSGTDEDYCERCDACFGNDLLKMLTSDIATMLNLELNFPEQYKKAMNRVNVMINASPEAQESVSMMYPTM